MSFDRDKSGKIALTIEEQLEKYTQYENSTERHDALWHGWMHNKRWMSQVLEWVLLSFPNYSRHDESHAVSVLHNIEMLLGDEVIRQLSASDCFLLLNSAYVHDIGMYITESEREEILISGEFRDFLTSRTDEDMKRYADLLFTACEQGSGKETDYKKKMQKNLDIYYAVLYLSAEYHRVRHADKSKNRLTDMVRSDGTLGAGFSTSGIPERFFYTIAGCAGAHSSPAFNSILELSRVDGGYAHDHMHPRFVALLLQLGDALDLDNDRFLPLVKQVMGPLPHESEVHFNKHKSIRKLFISPERIEISADCETPEELRLVKNEIDNIIDILKNAGYSWARICPRDLKASLPALKIESIVLQGQKISDELINARFEISQQKAFHLLQGSNIYKNDKFIFLREIFQNAIDASKRQYWRDWKGSRFERERQDHAETDEKEIWEYLATDRYPTEIEFHLAVKNEREKEVCLLDRRSEYDRIFAAGAEKDPIKKNTGEKYPKMDPDHLEYGVMIRVVDYGTGITEKDILKIASLGGRNKELKEEEKSMPGWLRPTAEFGIGLQSVFLITKSYKAYTHARNDEIYEIEFQATGYRGNSYINVIPKTAETGRKEYGATFEVFVPVTILEQSSEMFRQPKKTDPFLSNRSWDVSISKAREVIQQLLEYLNSIIGERLFPVTVKIYDFQYGLLSEAYNLNNGKNLNFSEKVYIDGILKSRTRKGETDSQDRQGISWLYSLSAKQKDDTCTGYVRFEGQKILYHVDFERARFFVYSNRNDILACMSAKRLMEFRREVLDMKPAPEKKGTSIYYKGIYVSDEDFGQDLDLLEYIDIKGNLDRNHIAVNRSDFTEEGKNYVRKVIYPSLLLMVEKALEHYGKNVGIDQFKVEFDRQFDHKYDRAGNQERQEEIHEFLIGWTGMGIFSRLKNTSTYLSPNYSGRDEDSEKNWKEILDHVSNRIEEKKKAALHDAKSWTRSVLYNMEIFPMEEWGVTDSDGQSLRNKTITYILNHMPSYAISSVQDSGERAWREYLFQVETIPSKNNPEIQNGSTDTTQGEVGSGTAVRQDILVKNLGGTTGADGGFVEPETEDEGENENGCKVCDAIRKSEKGYQAFSIKKRTKKKAGETGDGESNTGSDDSEENSGPAEIEKKLSLYEIKDIFFDGEKGEYSEREHESSESRTETGKTAKLRSVIENLKEEPDKSKRAKWEKEIESWPSDLYTEAERHMRDMNLGFENIILNWILENLPSEAIFFKDTHDRGDIPEFTNLMGEGFGAGGYINQLHINLMNNGYSNSIYLNRNNKSAVYRRIAKRYEEEGIMRFSMPACTSFCQLAVKEENPDVLFTKRGMVTRRSRRTIIIPLSGKSICNLFETVKNSKVYHDIGFLESLVEFLREGISNVTGGSEINKAQEAIFRQIKDSDPGKSIDEIVSELAGKFRHLEKDIDSIIPDDSKNDKVSIQEEIQEEKRFMEILKFCFSRNKGSDLSEDTARWMRKHLVPAWKILNGEIEDLTENIDHLLSSDYDKRIIFLLRIGIRFLFISENISHLIRLIPRIPRRKRIRQKMKNRKRITGILKRL